MILGQNLKKKKKRKPAGTFLIDIICVDSSCICHSLQMNFLLQYISQLKIFVIFFFYKDFHEQIHSRKNIKYNQMQFENRICLDSKFYYIFNQCFRRNFTNVQNTVTRQSIMVYDTSQEGCGSYTFLRGRHEEIRSCTNSILGIKPIY